MLTLFLAANDALQKLGTAGRYAQYQAGTTPELGLIGVVSAVINALLALIGVVFLALLIYAGFNYMTAGGDSDKVTKARETMTRAAIGLVIILLSYAIANFVIPYILCATGVSNACQVTNTGGFPQP